jgi:hypothetical protein
MSEQSSIAFADKVFKAALGTMETFNLYLGDRLGWFDALVEAPATAADLADRTKTQTRYAIEWLEMMAVYGNLTVLDDGGGDRLHRRYALPPGAAEVLTDRHSLNYLGAGLDCSLSSYGSRSGARRLRRRSGTKGAPPPSSSARRRAIRYSRCSRRSVPGWTDFWRCTATAVE